MRGISGGRVLFTATLVRGHIAKFHIPYLAWFQEQGWETWVASKNDYPDGICEIPHCDHFVNIDFARSPFSKQTLVAYRQLRDLFASEHFDLVHTHTPVGGVLTRFAARKARKKGTKVIYTAHGFHFYDGAPKLNWVLWYPIERFMSRFCDVLITINQEDYKRAKCFAHCRVEYVPGVGIDTRRFEPERGPRDVRDEFGFSVDDFVLLAVGDLTARKNHAAIVSALPLLDSRFKLLICGEGEERESLENLTCELGVASRVSFLGFRDDVADLMRASDVLVFPSVHEGLPVTVMEAMFCGLPVVATRIRGVSPDLITDGENGLLLPSDSPADIAETLQRLAGDEELGNRIAGNAKESAKRFDIDAVRARYAEIYESVATGDE